MREDELEETEITIPIDEHEEVVSEGGKEVRRRGVYLLPNLFTLAALFAGFYAVIAGMSGNFNEAGWAILIAGVCYGLDGRIARLTGTQSAFGAEFDPNRPLILKGPVTKIEWVNPHAWIHLEHTTESGDKEQWMLEGGTTNTLLRRGLNSRNLVHCTIIVVGGYQSKDRSNRANGRDITFEEFNRRKQLLNLFSNQTIVLAQMDYDKLVLKDSKEYLGEYVKTEKKMVYFKPQKETSIRLVSKRCLLYTSDAADE